MECWNKKCKYKGKPEWGNFKDKESNWITHHMRCPKCKGTNICMKGLEMLEYEIRYPSKCSGVKGETYAHPTVRKVINIHPTGYSIGCPICGWGMGTGGGKLDIKEIERLKKMYAESLAITDAPKVHKITCTKHGKIAIFCEDCMREKIEVVESRMKKQKRICEICKTDEYGFICLKCFKEKIKESLMPESYFLFKPNVETHKVCHNAKSENCVKCQEECDYSGKSFSKKGMELIEKPKAKFYCDKPACFAHYIANNKIKEKKENI